MQTSAYGPPACAESPTPVAKGSGVFQAPLYATGPLQHWQSKLSYMTSSSLQVVLESFNVSQCTYWSVPWEFHICSH